MIGTIAHRSIALLLGVLLLQFTLFGSGAPCMQHHDSAAAMHDMAGMTDHAPQSAGCETSSNHGCELPSAPGQCASMPTCGTPVAPIVIAAASVATHEIALDLPEPALIHSGPIVAPELPPPRA